MQCYTIIHGKCPAPSAIFALSTCAFMRLTFADVGPDVVGYPVVGLLVLGDNVVGYLVGLFVLGDNVVGYLVGLFVLGDNVVTASPPLDGVGVPVGIDVGTDVVGMTLVGTFVDATTMDPPTATSA